MQQSSDNRRNNPRIYGNECLAARPQQQRAIGLTYGSVSGRYPFKGLETIPFESSLERDLLIRLEFFSSVSDVIAQPVKIPFVGANGHEDKYTPDFLVYRHLGERSYHDYPRPELIEVKPREKWVEHWREWSAKWKAAMALAKREGWVFHIHDESRIRDQAFENIRFLERYARMNFVEEESRWMLDNIQAMGSAPLHYVLARHYMGSDRSRGIAHVWHLLAKRRLDGNIRMPLDENTELWVPDHV